MILLAVNTGSSSVRLALYARDGSVLRLLTAHHYSGEEQPEKYLREFIGSEQLDAVAHRVVHGGVKLAATCLIDEAVEAEIEHLAALAPLHNPRTGLDTRLPCAV